jgi:hypothetical protein
VTFHHILLFFLIFFFQQEESFEDIDPSQIVGRRTRGVKVDYSSAEAYEKAGIKPEEDEDEDDDTEMKH